MAKEHPEISLEGDSAGLLFLSHWSILRETTVPRGVSIFRTFAPKRPFYIIVVERALEEESNFEIKETTT